MNDDPIAGMREGSVSGLKWTMPIHTRRELGELPWNQSRLMHSYVCARDEDGMGPLLVSDIPGRMRLDLVGYAIVPLEMWNGLIDLAERGASAEAVRLLMIAGTLKEPPVRKPTLLDRIRKGLKAALAKLEGKL